MEDPERSCASVSDGCAKAVDEAAITRPPAHVVDTHWRIKRKAAYKTIEELSSRLSFSTEQKTVLKKVAQQYHMRVPEYYLSLIQDPADQADPVRMQCVPSVQEMQDASSASMDPLGETSMSPVPCLVHRYPDRVLLLVTGRCFMYCRHCTRKRLWKDNLSDPSLTEIKKAAEYIRMHPVIREVVVSGGDPLTLATERLDFILDILSKIPHVEVIRIGTRAPVVFPQRIDRSLCKTLQRYHHLWINVQFNHPREITPQSSAACRRLQECGIPLSNQSVLLKGVNDDPVVMMQLCHQLQSIRVRPYYLYQCDPVVGASHFRTPIRVGMEIMEKMRGHTGGLCVPTFVIDGPEGQGKVPIAPNYIVSFDKDKIKLRNYNHEVFEYAEPDQS